MFFASGLTRFFSPKVVLSRAPCFRSVDHDGHFSLSVLLIWIGQSAELNQERKCHGLVTFGPSA